METFLETFPTFFENLAEAGKITLEYLQGEQDPPRASLMPSKLLETATGRMWEQPRPPPLPLPFLLLYGDCVIQADYKGIIYWGICRPASSGSLANVFEMLSAWHARMMQQHDQQQQEENLNVRDAFEMELLSQLKESGYDCQTRDLTIQKFPHLKRDMIHLDLIFDRDYILEEGEDEARQSFRQRLMDEYDFSDYNKMKKKKEGDDDDDDDPSLAFVVLRSILKSKEMSKHNSNGGRLEEKDLDQIYMWFWGLKCIDEDSFNRDKAALLLELLQNAKLDVSQLVEIDSEHVYRGVSGHLYGRPWFKIGHPWRRILETLLEGGEEDALHLKDWNHQQPPLHLLLSRGLPGQDILVDAANKQAEKEQAAKEQAADQQADNQQDANEQAGHVLGTKCPIEDLYPFQLAAVKRDYGSAADSVVDIPDDTHRSLDHDQLSQVYSLMRASPVRVIESHRSLERDEAYMAAATKDIQDRESLEQKKRKLRALKKSIATEEESIATEEERLVEQRKAIENMPKYKKQRTTN